ncbi:MAG: Fic/DOC family N-terminal domain-containing protein [Candidatus Endonucleobacter bathymodioli]|uniref:Protein adenylyltransferase n=1 Tax=Candidatus Endonucleibacter bathymodioli TaxID=539814 RepID=A0AA90NUX5_9GAMM|nr:Fic/DOC family N-terminal domain-containing protein [Candidatus Endonucleobacter bathymodioli]
MKPYIPNELPLQGLDYKQLFAVVGNANAELARYDGLLQGIPAPEVMLSPLTTQEAVLSSKIEGTQATVDEVLEHEAGMRKDGEKENDIYEVLNYRHALIMSREGRNDRPIKLGFICELHKILLDSVRGQDKTPGAFRKDQNWIGKAGCLMEEASFIPPSPLVLGEFLQKWESYMGFDDSDFLLQTAVVHAQFELLHPFKDGNGRIGRLLIPLFLYQKKALSQPMFYLSEYLEAHRDEYYQRLKAISQENDWNGWILFFLKAVVEQAKQNSVRVRSIMDLYDKVKIEMQEITRSQYSVYLLDAIFSKPLFQVSDLVKQLNNECGIHEKTTSVLLRRIIKDADILKEVRPARGRRSAVLYFPRLIRRAEGKEI